jgi:hypothetical protein
MISVLKQQWKKENNRDTFRIRQKAKVIRHK